MEIKILFLILTTIKLICLQTTQGYVTCTGGCVAYVNSNFDYCCQGCFAPTMSINGLHCTSCTPSSPNWSCQQCDSYPPNCAPPTTTTTTTTTVGPPTASTTPCHISPNADYHMMYGYFYNFCMPKGSNQYCCTDYATNGTVPPCNQACQSCVCMSSTHECCCATCRGLCTPALTCT